MDILWTVTGQHQTSCHSPMQSDLTHTHTHTHEIQKQNLYHRPNDNQKFFLMGIIKDSNLHIHMLYVHTSNLKHAHYAICENMMTQVDNQVFTTNNVDIMHF